MGKRNNKYGIVKKEDGFTLIEVIVALNLGVLLLTFCGVLFLFVLKLSIITERRIEKFEITNAFINKVERFFASSVILNITKNYSNYVITNFGNNTLEIHEYCIVSEKIDTLWFDELFAIDITKSDGKIERSNSFMQLSEIVSSIEKNARTVKKISILFKIKADFLKVNLNNSTDRNNQFIDI